MFPCKTNAAESRRDARSVPFAAAHIRQFSTTFSSSGLICFTSSFPPSLPPLPLREIPIDERNVSGRHVLQIYESQLVIDWPLGCTLSTQRLCYALTSWFLILARAATVQ